MAQDRPRNVVMIGGPNGAGKTSWAYRHLLSTLEIREFVNADEIARGISPLNPESSALAAGRLMLQRLQELVRAGESFAFETTCAGRSHARLLQDCRTARYRFALVFLWLPSPEMALTRVARRVGEGGHKIPNDVVVRRYSAGIRNMVRTYLPLADIAHIYDNSDGNGVLIASRRENSPLAVHDEHRWSKIEEAAR